MSPALNHRCPAWCLLLALACFIPLTSGPALLAQDTSPDQDAYDAAAYYLRQGITAREPRTRDRLLLALRLTSDPGLVPYFQHLTAMKDETRAAHGALGLVECGAEKQINLARIQKIKEGRIQFQVIREAVDNDLLTEKQAREMLESETMDVRARLAGAIYLLKNKLPLDHAKLRALAASTENIHHQALCWALLVQAGDNSARGKLHSIENSDDSKRDSIRTDIMATIIKYHFDELGPWALDVCNELDSDDDLQLIALEAALRSGLAEAPQTWKKQFEATDNMARKLRLSLVALYGSPKTTPTLFDPMTASEEPLIKQMGEAGKAVASQEKVTEQILELLQMQYMPANIWALNYAKERAPDEISQRILLGMILALPGEDEGKGQRFSRARTAVQVLYERHPDLAAQKLRAIMTASQEDDLMATAVLLGLIDSGDKGIERVVGGLPTFEDMKTERLAILVRALGGQALDQDAMRELQYMVRGGSRLHETIRVRVGWAYLVLTKQGQKAIRDAIKP